MPRMYEPIWIKLKTDGKVFVKCANDAQRTVIKAVQKEKYADEDKYKCLQKMTVKKMKHGVLFTVLILPKPEEL